jgi:type II secretory pathway pseudopilin PulG
MDFAERSRRPHCPNRSPLLTATRFRRQPATAFTLVELLVVIGIIAILIGVLLPALSKARDKANRVVCLSNMRELSMALRLYAAQNKDQVPIGYMDQQNFNWFVNWNNSNGTKVSLLGLLPLTKLAQNPKVFYCPSVDNDRFMYNTPRNPWPPFEKWPNDPHFTTPGLGHTAITYEVRPMANWPPSTGQTAFSQTYGPEAAWTPYLGTNWKARVANDPSKPVVIAMPKLSKLKNKAIIVDLIISHFDVLRTHKTGINVIYANGGGQWVDLTPVLNRTQATGGSWSDQEVWKRWMSIPDDPGAYSNPDGYNDYFLCEAEYYGGPTGAAPTNKLPVGVWANLDRLSK